MNESRGYILSKINQTWNDKYYDFTDMWILKKKVKLKEAENRIAVARN